MKSFLLRWTITAFSVMVAAQVLPGISYEGLPSLLFAALTLGILNALLRPLLLFLSLPFIMVTLGFFILVVNAIVLKLASGLTPGFHVEGFWTTILGAVIISIVSWTISVFFRPETAAIPAQPSPQLKQARGRVIE